MRYTHHIDSDSSWKSCLWYPPISTCSAVVGQAGTDGVTGEVVTVETVAGEVEAEVIAAELVVDDVAAEPVASGSDLIISSIQASYFEYAHCSLTHSSPIHTLSAVGLPLREV